MGASEITYLVKLPLGLPPSHVVQWESPRDCWWDGMGWCRMGWDVKTDPAIRAADGVDTSVMVGKYDGEVAVAVLF